MQGRLGSASPLPPGVTARQRPQAFRELVTAMYVYSVSFRGLMCLLDLLGCGVGAATLWRDVQAVAPGLAPNPQAKRPSWVEVDETWLSLGGVKRPVAVVLGPEGERLDLRLSGPGFDWGGWFTDLAARKVQGVTTDDDRSTGRPRGVGSGPAAVHRAQAAHRGTAHPRYRRGRPNPLGPGPAAPPATPGPGTTAGGPVLLALWEAVMQGRVRLQPEVRKLLWHLVERWHELVRS